jgi:hypothetical protein
MKRKAQTLIVQQFLFLVENLVGIDERFQVFAYLAQFFGYKASFERWQWFAPSCVG